MSLSFTLFHHILYFNPAGTRETESFHHVEHKSRKAPWARSSAEDYSSALTHEVSKSSVVLLWASPAVRWETCSGRGTPWVTGGPLFTTCKLGFKGTVHPQMNIMSLFTHPHVDPNLYGFFHLWKDKRRGFKEDTGKYSLGLHEMPATYLWLQFLNDLVKNSSQWAILVLVTLMIISYCFFIFLYM